MSVFNVFADDTNQANFDVAYSKTVNFFPSKYNKIKQVGDVVLKYRKGQLSFARQIMDAIRHNQILAIQAGVGIGKTIGYLVPVFYSYNNVKKMKHFVISTSNIGLQQQLLTDINMVSNMLGIELKAVIAKGINNYACINRIEHALRDSRNSEEDKATIRKLLNEIKENDTIDKDELKQVSDEVWELVKLKSRGICSKCAYSKMCLYRKIAKEVDEANIVVTNHNILAKSVLDGRTFIQQSNAFIFDEAHQLESAIRDIQEDSIDLESIEKTLRYFIENNIIDDEFKRDYVYQTFFYIQELFGIIKKRACGYFYSNKEEKILEISDCDKIPFYVTKIEDKIDFIIKRLDKILQIVQNFNISIRNNNDYRERQLNKWIECFRDMKNGANSQNIYWATFYKKNNRQLGIKIGYTIKKVDNVTKKLIEKDVPIIFTSGTLSDSNGTYNYFNNSLSLGDTNINSHATGGAQAIPSPYDYKTHSLFYYDKNITDPNDNHQKYLDELVIKITELLKITDGKTLVLFTSKSDMNYVYEHLNINHFDFDILIQGQDKSNALLYNEFENNHKSCLFSTAAWEGLDVKGISLSNVIITRLPFSTDNAIMQYKQREFAKICNSNNTSSSNDKESVFLNDMLQKFAQGTGRLIRSHKDWGMVCCLDSRVDKYKDYIQRILPFVNYTDNIEDVYDFSLKHITSRGRPKKLVKNEDK